MSTIPTTNTNNFTMTWENHALANIKYRFILKFLRTYLKSMVCRHWLLPRALMRLYRSDFSLESGIARVWSTQSSSWRTNLCYSTTWLFVESELIAGSYCKLNMRNISSLKLLLFIHFKVGKLKILNDNSNKMSHLHN